jgi:hypothetical protein
MADIEDTGTQEGQPTETGQATTQDLHEEKALEWGWKPKDQFKGDPDTWVDAAEFVETRNPYTIIQRQSRELDTLKKTLNATANHVKKVGDVAYKRAIADLKKERVHAVERADADAVGEIDKEINELKQDNPADAVPPEFTEWVGNNAWFTKEPELYAFACASFDAQVKRNPDLGLTEVLETVTKATKRAYPEAFQPQTTRPTTSTVEGGASPSNTKTGPSYGNLNAEQKRVCDTFVRSGVMTKEAYVKSLVEIGEL